LVGEDSTLKDPENQYFTCTQVEGSIAQARGTVPEYFLYSSPFRKSFKVG
jgi:hypothetical protein